MIARLRRRLSPLKRRAIKLLYRLAGRDVVCNLCGWRGARLASDDWHPHTICPQCRSQLRHRLLVAALSHLPQLSLERLVRGKTVLHFAPEAPLRSLLEPAAGAYCAADLELQPGQGLDLALDIADMGAVADATQDLVLACDVLEHVPDDQRALRELGRVLRRGGWAILTVPQPDALAVTFGDPSLTAPEDRLRVFGQRDHVRLYGRDFIDRLAAAGFEVEAVAAGHFAPGLVRRHVLFPPVLSTRPLATNHRRVFFARKR